MNEILLTKFLGIHLDKKFNFANHIAEMSIKDANSIGLLYKLNRFLPETILKTLYTSLIHPCLSYGIEAWHGTYQNNTYKIFVLQKKAIRAINNLAYNEHTNAYFKCNKILKLSDQYNHNTRTNNQMSILRVNRSKTKYCVFHNGMITWNSLPDVFKVNISFSVFKSKVRFFIYKNIRKY